MGNRSREQRPTTIPPEHLSSGLREAITTAWQRGWQPADLARVVARVLDAGHGRLLAEAILAELAAYPRVTLDPRWLPQVEELRTAASAARATSIERDPGALAAAVRSLVRVVAGLPPLERLGPLPGQAVPSASPVESPPEEKILGRVRAMLAKAEATKYPAEADTFTAAAQELMARHSIDLAMLAAAGPGSPGSSEKPAGRRIGIDNPYEATKATLLDVVASANRCRSVWSRAFGFCTVLGYEADLDAVETLFTSLRVQATAMMTRAGTRVDEGGRSRTRSFRQSFLTAYAQRIGERLTEVTRVETAEAALRPGGENLLPVLVSRGQAVEDAVGEMFPEVKHLASRPITDAEGYFHGKAAADLATLAAGRPLTE